LIYPRKVFVPIEANDTPHIRIKKKKTGDHKEAVACFCILLIAALD
jgi:hypothetical protein